jgi:hypothetical protein
LPFQIFQIQLFQMCYSVSWDFTQPFAAKQHGCPLQVQYIWQFDDQSGSLSRFHDIKHRFLSSSYLWFLPELFVFTVSITILFLCSIGWWNFVPPLIPHGFFPSHFPAACFPRHVKHSLCSFARRHLVLTSLRLNFSKLWTLCSPLAANTTLFVVLVCKRSENITGVICSTISFIFFTDLHLRNNFVLLALPFSKLVDVWTTQLFLNYKTSLSGFTNKFRQI